MTLGDRFRLNDSVTIGHSEGRSFVVYIGLVDS